MYGADQNPAIDDFLYRCSCSSAAGIIADRRGFSVIDGDGRRAVQLFEGADTCADATTKQSVGLSALVPFARVLNPMIAPQKLHYEVPMAGDRSIFARHRRRKISVSSRSVFNLQILPVKYHASEPRRSKPFCA